MRSLNVRTVTVAAVAIVALGTATALAGWISTGTAPGLTVRAGAVPVPTGVTAVAVSGPGSSVAVTVTWSAGTGVAVTGYRVLRYRAQQAASAVCTNAATDLSCVDTGGTNGDRYTVQAVLHSWSSAESAQISAAFPAAQNLLQTPGIGASGSPDPSASASPSGSASPSASASPSGSPSLSGSPSPGPG